MTSDVQERGMMAGLLGVRLIPSSLMVNQVHVGDNLNGYRGSKHRSNRVKKKLLEGTRRKHRLITPIIESLPKQDIYQLPNGDIVGHPVVIEVLIDKMNAWGKQIGMPPLTAEDRDPD